MFFVHRLMSNEQRKPKNESRTTNNGQGEKNNEAR